MDLHFTCRDAAQLKITRYVCLQIILSQLQLLITHSKLTLLTKRITHNFLTLILKNYLKIINF
jgi:hypothetical protein